MSEWQDKPTRDFFERGKLYEIETLMPPQRLRRSHVLQFLDWDRSAYNPDTMVWNARPFAGTQELLLRQIKRAREVDINCMPYMNRVVR